MMNFWRHITYCYPLSIALMLLFQTPLISQAFYQQSSNMGTYGTYGQTVTEGGGGISCVDFDNDGLDDLTFATKDGSIPYFYKNTGGSFTPVTPSFIGHNTEAKDIIWVDYNADGHKDIFVCSENGYNLLYENDGSMNFTDVTAARGLPVTIQKTFGANFGDLNNDGNLELYITDYEVSNSLYSYDPIGQMFVDITLSSGTGNGDRPSFDASFFDFDLDGDLDIYLINDKFGFENTLYMNLGGNFFVDVSVPSMTNLDLFSMNAGIGDFNLDGTLDIFITDMDKAALLSNNGNSTFTDVAQSANAEIDGFAWTGNFIDYDNDLDLDLYTCIEFANPPKPNSFLVNNGNATFSEPFALSGGITGNDGYSSYVNSVGDFDNNGMMDLVVGHADLLGFSLYTNHNDNQNNSIKLELKGTVSHPQAFGARIEVYVDNITTLINHKHCSEAFLAQKSEILHFGIGTTNAIDSIRIHWPSSIGLETILGQDITINAINTITESSGVTDVKTYKTCFVGGQVKTNPIASAHYGTISRVNTSSLVKNNSQVVLTSELEVSLDPNFEVELGAVFEAKIEACNN